MVGIVVVSHSQALAAAAVALAREMVPDTEIRIEVAAGLDETTFGTDAVAILEAITAADDGDGVLVLMDVGSAVLSAELALELLEDEVRQGVELSSAPLVEGLLAAAVAAAGGAGLAEVAAESLAGLAGKSAQLGGPPGETVTAGQPSVPMSPPDDLGARPTESAAPAVVGQFTLINPHGLHARPAARLARLVATMDAEVRIRDLTTGTGWVSAQSLSRLTTLGAVQGHELEVSATGPARQAAVDAVLALAQDSLGDPAGPPAPSTSGARSSNAVREWIGVGEAAAPRQSGQPQRGAPARPPGPPAMVRGLLAMVRGLPAGPGIGIGPAHSLGGTAMKIPERSTSAPADERRRLDSARAAAARELRSLQAHTANQIGADEAAIFAAQLALLDDPELLADVAARIAARQSAEAAWTRATEIIAETIEQLDDDYLRTRSLDIREVRDLVVGALAADVMPVSDGTPNDDAPKTEQTPGVLIAPDLTAAQAAHLDPAVTAAVVLAAGSPTSHATILVRARGIPLVVAAGPSVLTVPAGAEVAVNGDTGEVLVNPDPGTRNALLGQAAQQAAARVGALRDAGQPARTTDGLQILVGASLGSLDDARVAADSGADLAGLVRTEFLFSGRAAAPEVDEQVEVYFALAEAIGGRRLTLRTLDVGGDKPLPYAPTPAGANPFLGVRGLRLSLAQPALFQDQLRAVVRVAHQTPVSVMFPMVSTLTEVHAARRLLDEVIAAEGRGTPAGLEVGIMVEVPAVALKAAEFAAAVDFFSIGTNDLTQYALAAERGNPDVAAIGDGYDPGVLALIRAVCRGATGGPPVAVCGDLAGDPRATALLVGLGVGTLSVSPPAIPLVKQAVRAVDSVRAADLATTATAMPGAAEVRVLCSDRNEG